VVHQHANLIPVLVLAQDVYGGIIHHLVVDIVMVQVIVKAALVAIQIEIPIVPQVIALVAVNIGIQHLINAVEMMVAQLTPGVIQEAVLVSMAPGTQIIVQMGLKIVMRKE